MFKKLADEFDVPFTYSPKNVSTDNASMIAWVGWELINAEQDVDIKDRNMNGLRRIPLGSYVEGLID